MVHSTSRHHGSTGRGRWRHLHTRHPHDSRRCLPYSPRDDVDLHHPARGRCERVTCTCPHPDRRIDHRMARLGIVRAASILAPEDDTRNGSSAQGHRRECRVHAGRAACVPVWDQGSWCIGSRDSPPAIPPCVPPNLPLSPAASLCWRAGSRWCLVTGDGRVRPGGRRAPTRRHAPERRARRWRLSVRALPGVGHRHTAHPRRRQ